MDQHRRVNDMWQELQRLGYYEFQIREMLLEWSGKAKISSLTSAEAAQVAACFQKQIDFARRCLTISSGEKSS